MSSPGRIEYTTQLVTLPIVTVKDSQYPDRIGPWRIRRARSTPESTTISYSDSGESKPSLKEFLAKVDEQCSHIEEITQIKIEDDDGRNGFNRTAEAAEQGIDVRYQTRPKYECWFAGPWTLCMFLMITASCFAVIILYQFTASPIMLPADAPSKTFMGTVAFLLCFAAAFIISTSPVLFNMVMAGHKMTRLKTLKLMVIGTVGGGTGGALGLLVVLYAFEHA